MTKELPSAFRAAGWLIKGSNSRAINLIVVVEWGTRCVKYDALSCATVGVDGYRRLIATSPVAFQHVGSLTRTLETEGLCLFIVEDFVLEIKLLK